MVKYSMEINKLLYNNIFKGFLEYTFFVFFYTNTTTFIFKLQNIYKNIRNKISNENYRYTELLN